MDPNGDGIIGEKEGRAIARSSAKSRASNMKYKKGLCATLALLTLSWIGNTVLVMVIVYVNFKKTLNKSSLHHISAISCPDLMCGMSLSHTRSGTLRPSASCSRSLRSSNGCRAIKRRATLLVDNDVGLPPLQISLPNLSPGRRVRIGLFGSAGRPQGAARAQRAVRRGVDCRRSSSSSSIVVVAFVVVAVVVVVVAAVVRARVLEEEHLDT